jgi:hypothetical protein
MQWRWGNGYLPVMMFTLAELDNVIPLVRAIVPRHNMRGFAQGADRCGKRSEARLKLALSILSPSTP